MPCCAKGGRGSPFAIGASISDVRRECVRKFQKYSGHIVKAPYSCTCNIKLDAEFMIRLSIQISSTSETTRKNLNSKTHPPRAGIQAQPTQRTANFRGVHTYILSRLPAALNSREIPDFGDPPCPEPRNLQTPGRPTITIK